jgi:hydroxyacylglutathione hydrolase
MKLTPVFSQDFASNIYLLKDEKSALIDASMFPEGLETLDYLILTHCHFDHTGMAKEIQEKTGCKIMMSEAESEFFEADRPAASAAKFFDFSPDLDFTIDRRLKPGDKIDLGGTGLEVILTPGHTPGSISLYEPENKLLFSGDTVFAEGFGRYDLLGGDREALKKSIASLAKLDVKEMFPGHGPAREGNVAAYLNSIVV